MVQNSLSTLRASSSLTPVHISLVLISFPADQLAYPFAQEVREQHPDKEGKAEIKPDAHQREKPIWIDKELVNENSDEDNEREKQSKPNDMAQQEQQRPEQ